MELYAAPRGCWVRDEGAAKDSAGRGARALLKYPARPFGQEQGGPRPSVAVRYDCLANASLRHMATRRVFKSVPSVGKLMQPLLDAMQALGGSASIEELDTKVAEILTLSEEVLGQLHDPERGGGKSEVAYRLAWARTYLRKFGLLENSSRGVWALTEAGRKTTQVDSAEVISFVREVDGREATAKVDPVATDPDIVDVQPEAEGWRQELATVLTTALKPDAFERLAQRLLRESGFISVEVLGRSGDGGIDGKGIARIHGLMSFHIFFQCKRYTRPITPSEIRDFRGAMTGRADKGLFITTSSFTAAAVREATRDGAPPIDLINGEELADKLKELGLGVKTAMVEKVSIDPKWFEDI